MSRIEDEVCTRIKARSAVGLAKYGVTMADETLTRKQWLVHLQKELMDSVVYLQKLIEMEDE